MNKIKVIKNEHDYKEALAFAEALMNLDPDPESVEGEKLSLLTTLIKDYEARKFPEVLPDPIEAIKFRMDQAFLKPIDLVPYIGSKSRVSEILSGKRQLTINMIRSLSEGLGIPAKVLIKKGKGQEDFDYEKWDNRLFLEMERRGYFKDISLKIKSKSELLKNYFSSVGDQLPLAVIPRKSHYRLSPLTNKQALDVWTIQVIKKANRIPKPIKFKNKVIDLCFMQELTKLSVKENGPILAQKHLFNIGIVLIIEAHFPKTYLDGATILVDKENPIIGLTLRYDRLDNFWFTLMHELAHIALHINHEYQIYYDEIENVKDVNMNGREEEADELAAEALLPKAKWEVSPARLIPSSMAAKSLADELGIHIAIIAGQIRHKGNKYNYLSKIVNEAKVRKYFF